MKSVRDFLSFLNGFYPPVGAFSDLSDQKHKIRQSGDAIASGVVCRLDGGVLWGIKRPALAFKFKIPQECTNSDTCLTDSIRPEVLPHKNSFFLISCDVMPKPSSQQADSGISRVFDWPRRAAMLNTARFAQATERVSEVSHRDMRSPTIRLL